MEDAIEETTDPETEGSFKPAVPPGTSGTPATGIAGIIDEAELDWEGGSIGAGTSGFVAAAGGMGCCAETTRSKTAQNPTSKRNDLSIRAIEIF